MILAPAAASFSSVIQFFLQGGIFMIPLLACSIVGGAVCILRGMALRRHLVIPDHIAEEIQALPPGDDTVALSRLTRIVKADDSALGKIALTAIEHLEWPKSEAYEAVQTRARHEVMRLETGLAVLEVIVGVAPLLGLLGAVSGLVTVFAEFGHTSAISDPRGIARGISEALSTTVVGMAIAIPALVAHSYFSKKLEKMAAEMESLSADLLNKLYYRQRVALRAAEARTGEAAL